MAELPHVDILCVVDGESLLRDFPGTTESSRHVFHGADEIQNYCRMITRDGSPLGEADQDRRGAINHHPVDAALKVRAKVGDLIRWRATSLTLDEEFDVEIEGFYNTNSRTWAIDICDMPESREALAPDEYYWLTTAKSPGEATYWLKFKVNRRVPAGSREVGYFDWDPGIVVEET